VACMNTTRHEWRQDDWTAHIMRAVVISGKHLCRAGRSRSGHDQAAVQVGSGKCGYAESAVLCLAGCRTDAIYPCDHALGCRVW
jgi:hypothetical protein